MLQRAASDYWMLISSGFFLDRVNIWIKIRTTLWKMFLFFSIVTRFSISWTVSSFVQIWRELTFHDNFGRPSPKFLCCRECFQISLTSNSARAIPFLIRCACEQLTSAFLQVSSFSYHWVLWVIIPGYFYHWGWLLTCLLVMIYATQASHSHYLISSLQWGSP